MPPNLKISIVLNANKITRGTSNSPIYAASMSSFEWESSTGGADCQNGSWNSEGGLGGLADEVEVRLR